MSAAAVGFGTQFMSVSLDALSQTTPTTSRSATRPLPPDQRPLQRLRGQVGSTNGADIFLRHGGEGPPLLLLHGNPLTHASWHKIAEPFASASTLS